MDDLRELYQEMILDHYKRPRNCHRLDTANHHAEGYNPLCGDKVTVFVLVDDNVIVDISFEGSGCAICTASTSVMTESLKGKTVDEAGALFGKFRELVTGGLEAAGEIEKLGKLAIFAGVREYPIRIKCATLAWHTFEAALADTSETVTTE
ncbi:MAG: Fe-S cluster assembly sulfur transfer protein SufU [Candidatus Krumholzibacteriia bacterium]